MTLSRANQVRSHGASFCVRRKAAKSLDCKGASRVLGEMPELDGCRSLWWAVPTVALVWFPPDSSSPSFIFRAGCQSRIIVVARLTWIAGPFAVQSDHGVCTIVQIFDYKAAFHIYFNISCSILRFNMIDLAATTYWDSQNTTVSSLWQYSYTFCTHCLKCGRFISKWSS